MKVSVFCSQAAPMPLLAACSIVLVGAPFANPESLGEAAAREAARKKETQSSHVYRAEDLRAAKGSSATLLEGTRGPRETEGGEYEAYLRLLRAPRGQVNFEDYPPLSDVETARLRKEAPGQGPLARLLSWEPGIAANACTEVRSGAFAQQHASELVTLIRDRGAPSGARQCAILVAAMSGGDRASADLRQALIDVHDDGDRYVRRAVSSMNRVVFPTEQAVAYLTRALRDPDYAVRGNAAADLAILGPAAASAVPALIEALEADWPQEAPGHVRAVYIRVVQALGQIGQGARAAIPALRKAAALETGTGRNIAQTALDAIQPPSVEERVRRLTATLRTGTLDQCGEAATSLGQLGPASAPAVPALIEALEAKWPRPRQIMPGYTEYSYDNVRPAELDTMRVRVVRALGEIGPAARPAIPVLTRVASGTDSTGVKVPEAAQAALAAIQRTATPPARK